MDSIRHPAPAVNTARAHSQNSGTLPVPSASDVAPGNASAIADPFDPINTGLSGIPVRVGNHISGFVDPTAETYYRKIIGSKHLLKKPLAITNDVEVLLKAEKLGAKRVRILDSESGIEYTAPVQLIHEYGVRMNRGFGDQLYLMLGYWVQTDKHGTVTPASLPKAAPVVVEAAQPSLFDMPVERKGGAY